MLRTIFGDNKSPERLTEQLRTVSLNTNVLITKLSYEMFLAVDWVFKATIESVEEAEKCFPTLSSETLIYCKNGSLAYIYRNKDCNPLSVAITSAGVADTPIVTEAGLTILLSGYKPKYYTDIGVNDLQRVMDSLEDINESHVIVSIQGFEGALPVVLAGLVDLPILAVPTSTGYGVSSDGYTALNTALTSCTSGISVVNIDNGFGAGAQAVRILEQVQKGMDIMEGAMATGLNEYIQY